MSSENTVRTFEFSAAGPGPWVPASNSLLVQTDVSVIVEAVTLIGQPPEVLGTVTAGDFDRYDTAHAFVRLVASSAGTAAVSASIPTPAGAGGGEGGSSATETTQLLVKTAVQASAAAAGTTADAAASTDTATATQVALAKRHNVLLSALMATPSDIVLDSAGVAFSPASCSHVYTYDGSDNMTTDAASDGATVRVKTMTYSSGKMIAETKWVAQ